MSYKGLTKAQREILEEEGEDCFDVDELPVETLQQLLNMNNHELFFQAANRFLSDKMMEKQVGGRKRW